jgi:hypothetical protein
MRIARILLAFAAALLMSGCVPSLHPLYTEGDLVLAPDLEGTWVETNGEDTWTFQKGSGDDYKLIHKEKGAPGNFDVHLVQLGQFVFLDIYPQDPDLKSNFYKSHLIRAHTFAKIELNGSMLRIGMLDPDQVKESITREEVKIPHERLDGEIVLTAPTAQLQAFVRKCAEEGKIFGDPMELLRRE